MGCTPTPGVLRKSVIGKELGGSGVRKSVPGKELRFFDVTRLIAGQLDAEGDFGDLRGYPPPGVFREESVTIRRDWGWDEFAIEKSAQLAENKGRRKGRVCKRAQPGAITAERVQGKTVAKFGR